MRRPRLPSGEVGRNLAEKSGKTAKRRGPGRPFQPGHSGNPGGRPKDAVAVRALARQRTKEAIETLTAIMRMGQTEAARVRAAEALLDRGWGRPTPTVGGDYGLPGLQIIISD